MANPDAALTGPPMVIAGALSGRLTLAEARRKGLHIDGDLAALARIRPSAAPAAAQP